MVLALAVILLQLLFTPLNAAPTDVSASKRPCIDLSLRVPASAQNGQYQIIKVQNNIDATSFAIDFDTWSSPNGTQRLLRNFTVSDTFDISAQLCVPSNGSKKNHLQIATHGSGFDKRYWDVAIDPQQYSYVDAALAAGYSILTYDRLGTGLSAHPDGDTIVQSGLELDILRSITKMARNGDLFKQNTSATQNGSAYNVFFDKIIHVGHSFGSILSNALIATSPTLSDAAVLTGYIQTGRFSSNKWAAWGLEYAPQNNATLFPNLSPGYIVPGTHAAMQANFFSTRRNTSTGIGGFDPKLLDYAYSIRQTLTGAEIASLSQVLTPGPAKGFKGPLQFVLAQFDYAVCAGDCSDAVNTEALKKLYPDARKIDTFMQPGTGHGLPFHKGANLGYQASLEWLNKNGL
ncbi:MAG: hypothetical protein Q9191_001624 [Dirinaria sp. TL-2023a]